MKTRLDYDHYGVLRVQIFEIDEDLPTGGFWRTPNREEAETIAAAIKVRHGFECAVTW